MTKKPFKVLSTTAMAAALATSALVPAAVFAAEDNVNLSVSDYIVEKDGQLYSVDTATFLEMKAGKVAPTPKFVKTAAGKVYDLNDYLEAKSSNIGATMQDALELLAEDQSLEKDVTYGNVEIGEDGTPIYKPAPPTDLKVETVNAITTTIKQAADQQLAVSVNDGQEVTVAELEAAGYTVAFAYTETASDINKATGVVDASKAPFNATFEYQVTVSKDGEKVGESTWTEVKALAATTAVKVLELGLIEDGSDEAFPTEYITLDDKAVNVVATKAENAFGDTEGVTAPVVKNIVSSDVTVVSSTGAKLNPRKEGTVTLTVEFVGIEEKVTYELEVKAAQVPAVVESGQTTKVQTTVENSVEISLVDQYGEALRSDQDLTYILKDTTGLAVETTTETVTAGEKGEVTFTLAEAGNYTVEVKKADKVIGTLNLEGVAVDATKIDTFTLTSAKSELDLKGATEQAPATLAVTTNGFVDGVKVSQSDVDIAVADKVLVLKSSNEKVATVAANGTVTAKAVGTTTISLVKVVGQKVTTFASYDVTVKNTTVQVDTLALKDAATALKVKDAADIDAAFVAANVTAGKDKDGKEIFDASMIANVEYVASNSQVIVTINDINGGKDFVFDVVVDEKAEFAKLSGATLTNPVEAQEEVLATEAVEAVEAVNVGDVITPAVLATEAVDAVEAVEAVEASEVTVGDQVFAFDADATEIDTLLYKDAADLATKIEAAVTTVTAVNDLGTITITAKEVGAAGNTIVLNDATLADGDVDTEATGSFNFEDFNTAAVEAVEAVEVVNVGDIITPAVLATEAVEAVAAVNVGDVITPAVTAADGSLVLTFSEAINLSDLSITTDLGTVAVADVEGLKITVSEDKKTVTVAGIKADSDLIATTITVLAGVTDAATGNVVTVSAPIDISLAE